METSREMLPCPKCGLLPGIMDAPVKFADGSGITVKWGECALCGMTGPLGGEVYTAERLWNEMVRKIDEGGRE